jgi:hypothetical protein
MTRWQSLLRWSMRPGVIGASLALVLVGSYLMNAPGLPTSGATFERLAGGPTFDFRFGGYTPAEFVRALEQAGPDGQRVYRNFMWLDVLFPAVYGIFWLGVFARATTAARGPWRWITVVPVATAMIDYAENLFVALGVLAFPGRADTAVAMASVATQAKGASTALLVLCALGCLVGWLLRTVRRS